MSTPQDPELILVDEHDEVVGYERKERCHDGDGLLHRAFSVYLFDEEDRLLLQRRSLKKRLWPGFWSNTCCSHPTRDRPDADAVAVARLQEELGITASLTRAFQYRYHAPYGEPGTGAESELCTVYLGRTAGAVSPDPDEVMEWRFVDEGELADWMASSPQVFTPWFRIAWRRIRAEFFPPGPRTSRAPD